MRQMRTLQDCDFRDGAGNMAIDCAILEAVTQGDEPPTLRLYGWNPFCLSLGYGQRAREADADALSECGWGLVRRPTGGKAILHGDELTYSLSLPLDHPLAGGNVVESYRRLSAGLLDALGYLNVAASAERQNVSVQSVNAGPVCFEIPSHYEISVAGRKLIGSAQMRRQGGMLQHGAIPLIGDVARICDVLSFERDEIRLQQKTKVRERAVTLAQVTGGTPTWSAVAEAIEQGFARAFDLEMESGKLSVAESKRADELIDERFGNPAWTNRR